MKLCFLNENRLNDILTIIYMFKTKSNKVRELQNKCYTDDLFATL